MHRRSSQRISELELNREKAGKGNIAESATYPGKSSEIPLPALIVHTLMSIRKCKYPRGSGLDDWAMGRCLVARRRRTIGKLFSFHTGLVGSTLVALK